MKSIKLRKEDLTSDKMYVCVYMDTKYIFKMNDNIDTCHYFESKYKSYSNSGGFNSVTENSKTTVLREANLQEQAWLGACILAGKYVEEPKEIMYEIY